MLSVSNISSICHTLQQLALTQDLRYFKVSICFHFLLNYLSNTCINLYRPNFRINSGSRHVVRMYLLQKSAKLQHFKVHRVFLTHPILSCRNQALYGEDERELIIHSPLISGYLPVLRILFKHIPVISGTLTNIKLITQWCVSMFLPQTLAYVSGLPRHLPWKCSSYF